MIAAWFVVWGCEAFVLLGALFAWPTRVNAARRQVPTPHVVWHVAGEGRGTPTVTGADAYFLSKRHEVVAVDMTTGRVRWRRSVGSGADTMGARLIATPSGVVVGDYDVVALDREGRERWRFAPEDGYGAGVYLGAFGRGLLFAGSPSGKVFAIDERTGGERWSSAVGDIRDGTVVAPVVDGSLVFVGVRAREGVARGAVAAFDMETGRERWHRVLPSPADPSIVAGLAGGPLVAAEDVVVASGDGVVHLFDRLTGRYRGRLPPVREPPGGLVPLSQDYRALAANGRLLFVGSLSGLVVAYDLDTRRERWRQRPLGASIAFGLASDDKVVYVPYLSGHLVALRVADGATRWQTTGPPGGFGWVPASSGECVLAASSSAGFFMFRR